MWQSLKLAVKSIWSNKTRSFLTMLGIIIGVASVIILVSVVSSFMTYMTSSFSSLGTNQITVSLMNLSSRSVDVDDMYDFYFDNKQYFENMSPAVTVSGTVKSGSVQMDATSVTGVGEEYIGIKGYALSCGRNIQYGDINARQKICVIGTYTANSLFGGAEEALGQTLKINGSLFTVVGVVEMQEDSVLDMDDGGTDDFVWIPYSCAVELVRNANISSYTFTLSDLDNADAAKSAIEDFLYGVFKSDSYYTVISMSEMLDTLNSMIAMVSGGLGGIAGISLLVAGVGVMNIMLVSVTERTREIGIRKALGARQGVIMRQFVIEAALTSSLGGIIGILIGSSLTGVLGGLLGLEATPTFSAVALSFSVSVGIGLIFGYMPAKRAAALNPIDALRSE